MVGGPHYFSVSHFGINEFLILLGFDWKRTRGVGTRARQLFKRQTGNLGPQSVEIKLAEFVSSYVD